MTDALPRALSPELIELADSYGVATRFVDWRGNEVPVPVQTVVAVLAALDVDASSGDAVRAAVEQHRLARWRRLLPPCVVMRAGWTPWLPVHVDHGSPVEVWIELESGERRDVVHQDRRVEPVLVDGRLMGEATVELPGDLPLGWHRLRARAGGPAGQGVEAEATLVVTPPTVGLPAAMGDRRAWGFMAQLYSVRSRRSWGIGDLTDLADLAGWSGQLGAGFVLVNPLHAAEPVGRMEPSPYLPTTRRFFNPLYLRVEDAPEAAYLPAGDRQRLDAMAAKQRRRSTGPGRGAGTGASPAAGTGTGSSAAGEDRLDRDAVWQAKRRALELVHRVPRSPSRALAYDAFLAREGTGLTDFATWCALAEEHGLPWQGWPAELHDPRSAEVASARDRLAERVDFYCWLQWLLDEQLAVAARTARAAGMPVGVMHDLAVGVHPDGADSWSLRKVLAQGISVGAPADAFNQQGQDWSQPPWRPDRLAELGYAPYRDMLRTVLRHAGGIRVDHVIGLFRLWWVPSGSLPSAGTYVRYDHEALVGILALEAVRAGALVVGEDLGTVEPWVRQYLAEREILGTSILWFEQDHDDPERAPLRPEQWRRLCLATVTTHDLPPTAGYLAGEHIRIRDELGLLTRPVAEERAADAAERRQWASLLDQLGLLRPGAGEQEVVEALHRFLTWTPARLLGVALPDAVGDRRAMNQPGTNDEYPNWRLPLADGAGRPVLLEELVTSERAGSLAWVVSRS